tara:strand:- start:11157 stop:12635 length:1479 start_codon:yes stop_codon:yes gene_type:complete
MKTTDFLKEVTVEDLNKKLYKEHNTTVDLAKYSKEQLEAYSKRIDAKLTQFETSSKFNDSLTNESYQKMQLIKQLVETAINQYIENPLEAVDEEDLGDDVLEVEATDQDVASDFAEDEKEEEPKDDDEEDEDKSPNNVSSMAIAALRQMLDDPSKLGLARRALMKITDHEKLNTITPQELDAIRGPLEKFFVPILDKGMQGITRTKPVLKTLGGGESVEEGAYEGYHKMPLKADVMKCIKDGMSEAQVCEKYKKCNPKEMKLMASSCMKEYKSKNESIIREGKMPSKAHVKKMCKDGKSEAEMLKMHPDADKGKLKAMIKDCKKELKESIINEGEEDKAALVMAAKDMVDRFTSFLEDVAEMSAEGMLELQDQIREELGQEQAEQFVNTVGPALEGTIENLKQSREALNGGVGIITGEGAPTDTIGAEEPAPEVDPEAPAEEPMDAPADDEFGASDPAMGGDEPMGREKRESYTPNKKTVTESARIFSTLSK